MHIPSSPHGGFLQVNLGASPDPLLKVTKYIDTWIFQWVMWVKSKGAELSWHFFLHFFFSGLGSVLFHCFSSNFHQFSNCFC